MSDTSNKLYTVDEVIAADALLNLQYLIIHKKKSSHSSYGPSSSTTDYNIASTSIEKGFFEKVKNSTITLTQIKKSEGECSLKMNIVKEKNEKIFVCKEMRTASMSESRLKRFGPSRVAKKKIYFAKMYKKQKDASTKKPYYSRPNNLTKNDIIVDNSIQKSLSELKELSDSVAKNNTAVSLCKTQDVENACLPINKENDEK